MKYLMETRNLVKQYKDLTAVNGVDLSITKGICFGLLGPNGAGKTTLIEVIEDIILPTSGEVLYKGAPRTRHFREEIGIMFQQTALLSFLTVVETIETFREMYELTESTSYLVNLCHLEDIQHQMNDKISGGQKQRLMLALALLNRPELVFLDEPSTGLDPQARRNMWNIVRDIKQQGKTIVLTTHYMEEAQYLCDEVAIMDHGKIIAQGSPSQLIKSHCEQSTLVIPKTNLEKKLNAFPWEMKEKNGCMEILTSDVNGCVEMLLNEKVDLTSMLVKTPNLEDVFIKLTGRRLRD